MKDTGMAYLLWIVGLHRFYLNRPFSGLLYLMSVGCIGFWALLDLLLIPGMVREENRRFRYENRDNETIIVVDSNSGRRKRRRRDDDDYDD